VIDAEANVTQRKQRQRWPFVDIVLRLCIAVGQLCGGVSIAIAIRAIRSDDCNHGGVANEHTYSESTLILEGEPVARRLAADRTVLQFCSGLSVRLLARFSIEVIPMYKRKRGKSMYISWRLL
jgi:hypothetical protein